MPFWLANALPGIEAVATWNFCFHTCIMVLRKYINAGHKYCLLSTKYFVFMLVIRYQYLSMLTYLCCKLLRRKC